MRARRLSRPGVPTNLRMRDVIAVFKIEVFRVFSEVVPGSSCVGPICRRPTLRQGAGAIAEFCVVFFQIWRA